MSMGVHHLLLMSFIRVFFNRLIAFTVSGGILKLKWMSVVFGATISDFTWHPLCPPFPCCLPLLEQRHRF